MLWSSTTTWRGAVQNLDTRTATNERAAAEDGVRRNAEDGDLGQQGEPGWHGCLATTNGEAVVEPDDGAAGVAQNLNSVRKTAPWMVENGRGEDSVVADTMVTETWAWSTERGRGLQHDDGRQDGRRRLGFLGISIWLGEGIRR
jgi:hypothetical protein